MVIDFTVVWVLIAAILIHAIFAVEGYLRKKAAFPFITLALSLGLIVVHVLGRDMLDDHYVQNVIIDCIFLAVSVTNMLIIDEIETRRAIIKNVFSDKYDK